MFVCPYLLHIDTQRTMLFSCLLYVCACAVVKPESVVNPYGSTAGAHSGEFHMYRKTRNAEMQRMAAFHAADAEHEKDAAFHSKLQHDAEILQRKTNKKRNKRQKSKESKVRRKNLQHAGIDISAARATAEQHNGGEDNGDDDDQDKVEDEDEFPLILPLPASMALASAQNGATAVVTVASATTAPLPPPVEFANDGSFLEMAQKKLAATEPTTATTTKTAWDDSKQENE
jgi:Protein of unknown function (DUF1168)